MMSSHAPIRVLAVDHTAGIAPFRRKFAALARHPEIDLTVLAPNRWVENYRRVSLDVRQGQTADGYRLRTGSIIWPGYENRGMFTTGLIGAMRTARPDILHLWEEPFSVFALQALWLRRFLAPAAKAIFVSSDNLTRDGRYPYRPSWFYRRVEQYAFRACEAGTAVSAVVADVLRIKGYSGPIEVIPHGLDITEYPERLSGDKRDPSPLGLQPPVIGYFGRLRHQKGVDTLLRAFATIPSKSSAPAPTLAIIGDGPDREALLALTGELGLRGRVHFLPGVTHGEAPAVYRGIDVLVVPSRTTPKSVEQFGRVLIEGMAAGCVVIGSSSGGIPQVLGDAGIVFPEDDVPALSAALGRALWEGGLGLALRAKGRDRVRDHYTWDAVAATVVRLYRTLLARGPRD